MFVSADRNIVCFTIYTMAYMSPKHFRYPQPLFADSNETRLCALHGILLQ